MALGMMPSSIFRKLVLISCLFNVDLSAGGALSCLSFNKKAPMDQLLKKNEPAFKQNQATLEDPDPNECFICQNAQSNRIFMPCCHKVCEKCAPYMKKCPFCRKDIWEIHKL